jgi:hypothetical protein
MRAIRKKDPLGGCPVAAGLPRLAGGSGVSMPKSAPDHEIAGAVASSSLSQSPERPLYLVLQPLLPDIWAAAPGRLSDHRLDAPSHESAKGRSATPCRHWCFAGRGPQSTGQRTLAVAMSYVYCPRNSAGASEGPASSAYSGARKSAPSSLSGVLQLPRGAGQFQTPGWLPRGSHPHLAAVPDAAQSPAPDALVEV